MEARNLSEFDTDVISEDDPVDASRVIADLHDYDVTEVKQLFEFDRETGLWTREMLIKVMNSFGTNRKCLVSDFESYPDPQVDHMSERRPTTTKIPQNRHSRHSAVDLDAHPDRIGMTNLRDTTLPTAKSHRISQIAGRAGPLEERPPSSVISFITDPAYVWSSMRTSSTLAAHGAMSSSLPPVQPSSSSEA